MNDFDDLDDVFAPLRSAATPDELAAESTIVDAMARNHRHTKGSTMFSSRRTRVAAFVAAGVLGFSGVAAAGYGDSLDPSLLESMITENDEEIDDDIDEEVEEVEEAEEEVDGIEEVEEEVDEIEEVEAEVDEVAATQDVVVEVVEEQTAEPATEDPDTYFLEAEHCLSGNHGKTVSAAARGDRDLVEEELGSVEAADEFFEYDQRDVAQSSCGKDYEGVEVVDDDENEQEDVEEKELDDDDSDDEKKKPARADKPGKPDHAGKQGKGQKGKKG